MIDIHPENFEIVVDKPVHSNIQIINNKFYLN